jgi:filamentous hemagglutinin family protein
MGCLLDLRAEVKMLLQSQVGMVVRRILSGSLVATLPVAAAHAADLPIPAIERVTHGRADFVVQDRNFTINQLTDRVTLNWQSFDIGAGNSVQFNQPGANAVALNRIFQASPSRIEGALRANGQIYLVNQNGIIFGKGAQVSTGSLVATSLGITDDIHERLGIIGAINEGQRAALQGGPGAGAVKVEQGATITAASGGRVILAAPEVENAGTIRTPDGQAILAGAADRVYLAASSDPELRGILVEVGNGGTATNLGQVIAERGNVSMIGLAVNQNGLVSATTSVSVNGSIRLAARDQATVSQVGNGISVPRPSHTGQLTLGAGSRTIVGLDEGSSTAVDAQTQPLSLIEAMGADVSLERDALVSARGGRVTVQATQNPISPGLDTTPDNTSRLRIDAGATIDVSGLTSAATSISRNIVAVEARGNELRDQPLQREGVLRGETVYVDVRKGTDMLDISGAVANIARPLDERLAAGGSIELGSEGDLRIAAGAKLDVSGGQVTYTGASYDTTHLIRDDGSVVDISEADPGTRYRAIWEPPTVIHERWGVKEQFPAFAASFQHREEGYVEGLAAGTLTIAGRTMAVEGNVLAGTTIGRYQRLAPAARSTESRFDQLPLGGALSIRHGTRLADVGLPEVRFGNPAQSTASTLILDPTLFSSGIGSVNLQTTGRVVVSGDQSLQLPAFSSLELAAGKIDIQGDIILPGGSFTATARLTPLVPLDEVALRMSSGASIDAGAQWTNDSVAINPSTPANAVVLDGGRISLASQGDLLVASGSSLDADGGAWLRRSGTLSAGKGGTISVAMTGNQQREFQFAADARAYALHQGGSLRITANEVLVAPVSEAAQPGELVVSPEFFTTGGFSSFQLTATTGGLTLASGAIAKAQQQNLMLRQGMERAASGTDLFSLGDIVTLPDHERLASSVTLAARQRSAAGSAAMSLLTVESGAGLAVDAGGSLNLSSDGSVQINGSLDAPGGSVNVALVSRGASDPVYRPEQKIWVGDSARITATGTTVMEPDPQGLRTGEVYGGGSITLNAARGAIVLNPGSLLDASGTSATLDLPDYQGMQGGTVPVEVDGAAGRISLTAAEAILAGGDMLARASTAPGARGGELAVTLDPRQRDEPDPVLDPGLNPFPQDSRQIEISSGGSKVSLGQQSNLPDSFEGIARLDADSLGAGGFDSIELRALPATAYPTSQSTAQIRFVGDVSLSPARQLILDAPILAGDGARATLSSAYVAVGSTDSVRRLDEASVVGGRVQADPSTGSGTLRIDAGLLDLVGDTALQGFAAAPVSGATPVVFASRGDIRLRGTQVESERGSGRLAGSLRSAGDLELRASQVFPTTMTEFLIEATSPQGVLTIAGNGAQSEAPLSAGGALTLQAAEIRQQGTLRAPFGTLNLQAERIALSPGSLTSVSGDGVTTLFGQTEFQRDLVYPLQGFVKVFESAPAKQILLQAPVVSVAERATIDVSGGGELRATEFVPGPGGSRDILAVDAIDGAFAIAPVQSSVYAAYDPLESSGFDYAIGTTFIVAPGGPLPAGEYAVLPPRYALLGGYLVTPQQHAGAADPGSVINAPDGSSIVAGRFGVANIDSRDSLWSQFRIEPASVVRKRAEYAETSIDSLFAGAGTQGTNDSGYLRISATESLQLAGTLAKQQATGIGSRLDIVANVLEVTNARSPTASSVQILADELEGFGAASVLLGGTRASTENGEQITVSASRTTVADGVDLQLPELTLVALEDVAIGQDVSWSATGTGKVGDGETTLSGDAAIVRLSQNDATELVRVGATGVRGSIQVGDGSRLSASGSMLLDASRDSVIGGTLRSEGGSIALGAGNVALGNAPAGTSGLVLDTAQLAQFEGEALHLRSDGSIRLLGDLDLDFGTLTLDADGLAGVDGGDKRLSAGTISLTNQGNVAAVTATGTGSLSITAQQLRLDEGQFSLAGFGGVDIALSQALLGSGVGRLTSSAPTRITTPLIVGQAGSKSSMDVAGRLEVLDSGGAAPTTIDAGIGARWQLSADSIRIDTNFQLPSGQFTAQARGATGIELGAGAVVDVSGTDLKVANVVTGTPGGSVRLEAQAGDLRIDSGAVIDVSGGNFDGDAGGIELAAPGGELAVASGATLRAASRSTGTGDFSMDALRLNDFGGLNAALNQAGFAGTRAFRQRTGNLDIAAGQNVRGTGIEIAVDGGALTIAGTVTASGEQAGDIELSASGDIAVRAGGRVVAAATGASQSGGSIRLESMTGNLSVDAGAELDVSGTASEGGATADGSVTLAARRVGDADLAISRVAGQVRGAARVDLEAVKRYDVSATGQFDGAVATQVRVDNDALAAGSAATLARLGLATRPEFHLVSGVDVVSAGNLTVSSNADLSAWRSGGEVGHLRLRAAGDLNIANSISDGFKVESVFDVFSFSFTDRVRLQEGPSWSYDLVAGADLGGAGRFSLGAAARQLAVGNDVVVRTGTGDISLASSGDVRFGNQGSVVYTAGEDDGFGALQDVTYRLDEATLLPYGELVLDALLGGGEFGARGGDVLLRARGDVLGAGSDQLFVDWQPRAGGAMPERFGQVPAYWGINYGQFRQGIGALGGGDVRVAVGGSLRDLSISIPTTGKAAENVHVDEEQLAQGTVFIEAGAEPVLTEVNGGGNLKLDVGGDILGANILVARGEGRIKAGGDVRNAQATGQGLTIAMADADVSVAAGGSLVVENVLNPTIIRTLREALGAPVESFFFTYAPDASVSLTSVAGDVVLRNRSDLPASHAAAQTGLNQAAMQVYPASLKLRSFAGNVRQEGTLTTFPSASGAIDLLAAGDLLGAEVAIINQSDADPQLLPRPANPLLDVRETVGSETEVALARLRANGVGNHALIPVHTGDTNANRIVAGKSLGSVDGNPFSIFLAKRSLLATGTDAGRLALHIQHNNPTDHSTLEVGGDLVQPSPRSGIGQFVPDTVSVIQVSGPGQLDITAGGTIDLGTSRGVLSVGDTINASLPDQGANISILAGAGDSGPAWDAFAQQYLAPTGKYTGLLREFLAQFPPGAGSDLERFRQLPEEKQRQLLTGIFFQEIRVAGIAGANQTGEGYKPGFDAIKLLFPQGLAKGDLISLLSQISTIDGGNIQLLVPNGLVNAGVASATALSKGPEQLGIVAQRDGDIEAFTRGDFIVNQSRVFVLDGGDITIWSSEGDIDAGRGAKTALAVPPPRVSIDAEGNLVVEFPPAISGSGIRGAVSTAGRKPGDVYLFAPAGVVDAGDAGIGSAGNITIGATEVLGADNIDVGGVSVGVPVDTGGVAAGLTSVSGTASSASNAATEAASGSASAGEEETPLASTALGWLDVFVEGFGEEVCKPNDEECLRRQQRND